MSRLGTFFRVIFPLSWPGILTGLVLTFAHAVGEFGVVLMVGGNIPGVTRTLSVAIYDDVQALDYASANTTALFLLGLSFWVLCAHMAKASFTSVGNSADSPKPLLRLSPATGHVTEILDI